MRVSRGRGGFEDISRAGLRGFRARVTRRTVSIRFFGGGIFMATLPSRCVSRGGVRVQASTIDETRSNCFSSDASDRDRARSRRARRQARSGRVSPTPMPDPNERELGARLKRHLSPARRVFVRNPARAGAGAQFRAAVHHFIFRSRKTSGLTQQLQTASFKRAPLGPPGRGRGGRTMDDVRGAHRGRAPYPTNTTPVALRIRVRRPPRCPSGESVRFQRRFPFPFRVSAANALTSSPA